MGYSSGDQVEVCSREEGLLGSYYPATVIMQISKIFCVVQYKDLLKEDESGPLREIASGEDMRPSPPETPLPAGGFSVRDKVDAFDNDGWWVGKIVQKKWL